MFCIHCGHELDSNNVCHNNSCPSKMNNNQAYNNNYNNMNYHNNYKKINYNPDFIDKNGITSQEMATFIGNSSISFYIEKWTMNQDKPSFLSWNWPAFFSSWVWLFYRKLYLFGGIYLAVNLLSLIFLPLSVFSVILFFSNISCALLGNQIYIRHCTKNIKQIKSLPINMDMNAYFRRLKYSGGVSIASLILGIIIYVVATIFIIFNFVSDNHMYNSYSDPFSIYDDYDSKGSYFDDDSDDSFYSNPHSSKPGFNPSKLPSKSM
ncbi:DUF2628 domain-containing protein [Clostridium sp. SHJSY1]|uniref:DUF2628 domain-containing protein n=1 Tax=Clostridium sp. SHJSY1 TaxID=2942483 RepID=UPI0028761030|nr:DUF2628 domain-containing protein [Clostridium sp. SHJSY1]MDS0526965.1 DUF2628 domain-containing protein [Clostridium sp. SHJSY1]